MINYIEASAVTLAAAAKGNPVTATVVVFFFMLLFNLFESSLERLIFGERFEHWMDPLLYGCFIAYAGYAVYACAEFNSTHRH